MSSEPTPPTWKLPRGVDGPLWRYATTPRLAAEEDDYFLGHPLFERDRTWLAEQFRRPGRLIDLGCGAGRHAIEFARRGFQVTAVDLAEPMLRVVRNKAEREGVSIATLRANLCDLRCLPDQSYDVAISMFSTLGMIRGDKARRRALSEAHRVLAPGGGLALHAHNLWLNLRDPRGRRWLLGNVARSMVGRDRLGERAMTYRGIPGMELHLYRWGELRGDIQSAGLEIDSVLPIDEVSARPIPAPWLLPSMRAGGWLILARRPS